MAKDFDLTSQKWLALVFEGKNTEYGAYVLRDESSNRHLKSLIIVTIASLAVVFLPNMIKSVLPAPQVVEQVVSVDMTDLSLEDQVPEENQLKDIEMPPPPPLKETVQFTPPVVTKDEDIKEEDLMLTQQELTDNKADISIITVAGDENGTVDIRDVIEHKVVIEEEPKNKVWDHVEQMPAFPGGDAELLKWLAKNIEFPTIAIEQGVSGTVMLKFVVTTDGTVGDVEIVKGLDPNCDKAAIRGVKKMPRWTPGKQNGVPVNVWYQCPVKFKLQ
jgi:protein TonB